MIRATSAALLILVCRGGSGPPAPTSPELRHLAIFCGKYSGAHGGQPPKDEAQFKQFITALDPNQLAAACVSATVVDTLFISPRDAQSYNVRYNDPQPPDGPNGPSAVIMERVGKNVMRFVAYSTAKVKDSDDAQYQKVRFTNR